MATDLNAVVHIKDENGNVNNIFPATKIANVEGLQSALNAKANSSDVTSGLAGKVDKVTGKGLSTNDYTTAEKNKLAGVEAQANKTVVDSALSSSSTNPVQNKVINTALGTKADSSTVTALAETVSGKADSSTVSSLSSQVSTNTTNIATQTARIDAIASLPSGSTSGDAELMDIRIKADGRSAASAGDSVREQISSAIKIAKNTTCDTYAIDVAERTIWYDYAIKAGETLLIYNDTSGVTSVLAYSGSTEIGYIGENIGSGKYALYTATSDANRIKIWSRQTGQLKMWIINKAVEEKIDISSSLITVGWIENTGTYHDTDDGFRLSSVITLNKGDKVIAITKGYQQNVSIISKVDGDNSYSSLVADDGTTAIKSYEYMASDITYVKVCCSVDSLIAVVVRNNSENIDAHTQEIFNARSAYDGRIYASIGEAVKKQIENCFKLTLNNDGNLFDVDQAQTTIFYDYPIKSGESFLIKNNTSGITSVLAYFGSAEIEYMGENIGSEKYVLYSASSDANRIKIWSQMTGSIEIIRINNKFNNIVDHSNDNYANDAYITSGGRKASGESSSMVLFDPVAIHKGDRIIAFTRGYQGNVSIISKVNEDGTYSPLVIDDATSTVKSYEYVATEDMIVVVSCYSNAAEYITVSDLVHVINNISSDMKKNTSYTSIALFEKIGVIGDSYASGEIYSDASTVMGDFYNLSWGQMMARKNGVSCLNLSSGGLTTASWLTAPKGLSLLNSSEAQDLYIIALGINDVYSILKNDESYIGSESDIGTDNNTLWRNMAVILNACYSKNSNARIVILGIASRPDGNASWQRLHRLENSGLEAIAEYFNIPYKSQMDVEYFNSEFYKSNMVGGHPVAINYSGMAVAIEKMVEDLMKEYPEYFKTYPNAV